MLSKWLKQEHFSEALRLTLNSWSSMSLKRDTTRSWFSSILLEMSWAFCSIASISEVATESSFRGGLKIGVGAITAGLNF